jgi:hypothetical protein
MNILKLHNNKDLFPRLKQTSRKIKNNQIELNQLSVNNILNNKKDRSIMT